MLARQLSSAAVAAALVLLAAPGHAQEATLRAAMFVPPNTTFGEMCGRFVEHVNSTYKGTVQIRVVGGPDAVPPFEQGNALRTGVLDVACLPPAFYVSAMPEADVAILSTLNFKQQRQSGAWEALNKAHNQRMNAWLLAAYGDGVEFHVFTNRPVASMSDLKAMKLRTTPNYTPFFSTIGATLINTPPGEVRTALERGVVDGYGWPVTGIFDLGWASFTKFRIDPGFYNVVVNVLVNYSKWTSLTDAQRAALTKGAEWLENENIQWAADKSAGERKRQAEAGIKPVDLGPSFRKQAYDAYWAELTKRAPDAVKTLRPLFDK
jgi:TRAP-type C4-dicarboxylate transport system substrate-binding protein